MIALRAGVFAVIGGLTAILPRPGLAPNPMPENQFSGSRHTKPTISLKLVRAAKDAT
jgi:hypothetical protein